MKKTLCLLTLCALLTIAVASAETIPAEVQAYYNDSSLSQTWEVFDLPEGGRFGVLLTEKSNYIIGYREEGTAWTMQFQISVFDGGGTYLQRFGTGGDAADGDVGFELLCDEPDQGVSFRWDGTDFTVCGWRNARWQVTLRDGILTYRDAGGSAVEVALASQMGVWLHRYADLPQTPDDAKALLTISPEAAATLYPSFTLCEYGSYNGGDEASASYACITDDGMLRLVRAHLTASKGIESATASMDAPLSAELLARAQTTPLKELFCASGESSTFLTDNPLDTARVPIEGKIVQSDLQACGLQLLTEADGARRVSYVTMNDDRSYRVRTSPLLPADTRMDIFHSGEGSWLLEWGGELSAGYELNAGGGWQVVWIMYPHNTITAEYGRVILDMGGDDERTLVGALPDLDLLANGVGNIPADAESIAGMVERDGYAVVRNPDPGDRLHLRVKPDRAAESIGKFYNGTVVFVLETKGDWAHVAIGTNGVLEGWMMRRYLCEGADMDAVGRVGPGLFITSNAIGEHAYSDAGLVSTLQDMSLVGLEHVIGLVEAEGKRPASYIVIDGTGRTGYIPADWLIPGDE